MIMRGAVPREGASIPTQCNLADDSDATGKSEGKPRLRLPIDLCSLRFTGRWSVS